MLSFGAMEKQKHIAVVGAGLAGSEAALQLARRGVAVTLFEMRPEVETPVHKTAFAAELVCSNSLKGMKPDSAAGMLKAELAYLGSHLLAAARENAVAAGGALAVDRDRFAARVTALLEAEPLIALERGEVVSLEDLAARFDGIVLATGPLTSDGLGEEIARLTGREALAFYDAAAPIVMTDSLDGDRLVRQSRYEEGAGDYLNAFFDKEEYERFIDELLSAQRVVAKDFESKDLFQACQPIEEIARAGRDAPRFGTCKPVGLTDPRTGRRPWAAVQLRAENAAGTCYNLVGFQTNLTFPEQKRVFSLIPGLENAEFARYGVMHRNTFIDAPRLLDPSGRMTGGNAAALPVPLWVAGQLGGTEGYCEAIRSGLHCALSVAAWAAGEEAVPLPPQTAFGALMAYATDPATVDYQPMHVNFGMMPPLAQPVRNKRQRYQAYAARGKEALVAYGRQLAKAGLLEEAQLTAGEQAAAPFLPADEG